MSDFTWIDTEQGVSRMLDELCTADSYAVDTEFISEGRYFADVALIQLATHQEVFLVDPLKVDVQTLRPLFEGDGVALMHASSQDLEIFSRVIGALPKRLFDTQIAARFLGHGQAGLGKLIEKYTDVTPKKDSQLVNWLSRPLDKRALRYAASDVAYLHQIFESMRQRLERKGRLSWAEQECERERTKERGRRELRQAWWKVKARNKLSTKSQLVLQELAAWRERQARQENIPASRLLSDLSLMALSSRPPHDAEGLGKVRGLSGGHARRFGADILNVLEGAQKMHRDELVEPGTGPTVKIDKSVISLCMAWLNSVAEKESLDPSLIASRGDLEDFMATGRGRLGGGWRFELVGDDIAQLLDGQAALGISMGRVAYFERVAGDEG